MSARIPNPYRPGFNQTPVVLAGRQDILEGAGEALEVAALDGRTPRPLILVGPRGLGKTVTLHEIASLAAERRSWPTVHVEATVSLLDDLISGLTEATALLCGDASGPRRRRTRITGGSVEAKALGVGGSLSMEAVAPDQLDLPRALQQTMEAATGASAGLVLTLDELHAADAVALGVLGACLQESVSHRWPLVVAIAALPSLRNNRGRRRLPTYLERAEWHELEPLQAVDARQALTGPARQAGRPMTDEAAELLLRRAGGYPYAIQVAGHYAWRAAHGADRIDLDHAREAGPRINRDLVQLFKSRWDGASPREQQYLVALAAVSADPDQGPTGGDVATRLGVATTEVSYLRDRLIKKGTIYSDAAGRLRFITPGMGRWLRDREDS